MSLAILGMFYCQGNDVYLEYINMDPVRPETSSTMQVFFYEVHLYFSCFQNECR